MARKLVVAVVFLATVTMASAQQAPSAPEQNTTTTTTTTTTVQSPQQNQQNPSNIQVEPMEQTPTFQVNVVERTTQAVDYRDRGGSTEVQMRGTELMPSVTGEAKITGKAGRLALNVSLKHMRPARSLGLPFLTYVLWAITPEGRPVNLGEVLLGDDDDMKTQVTTSLSSFGLIVTAEPYFAVTQPGDAVVAENIIPNDVKGFIRTINAKFGLMEKGQYTSNIDPKMLPAASANADVPLQLLEARDAIAIAKAEGAEQYASDTLRKAEEMLVRAEDYYVRKQGPTPIGTASRSATQSAEAARLLTINKKEEDRAEAAREKMRQRIQSAQTEAEAQAERAKLASQEAADEAARRARAEQERESAQRAAEAAERARLAAEQQAQQSQQQLAAAQQQAQEVEKQRQEVAEQRQKLVQQLNSVLQTKDTARGVVSQMSDVLFDVNKATLKTDTQIRLAKISGIILSYPDLKLEIDGYTDSTGTPQWNQTLSLKRAAAVRDFLISQGVSEDNVTAQGFGQENPIAPNSTAAGRKMNRRVELVLSGSAIGSAEASPPPPEKQ